MTHRGFLKVLAMGLSGAVPGRAADERDTWEDEVTAVEARLARLKPSPGCLVFAGSSSIRLWPLERSFPGMGALNAGFGGSTLAACTRHAPRLVHVWKPRTVVLYAGDNDVASGLSADEVVRDFTAFATSLHGVLPACRLVNLSIKPSPSRWKLWPVAAAANARIRTLCESVGPAKMQYVDLATPLLGPDGQPDHRLFLEDRLHLNDAGYAKWAGVLTPVLAARQ